MMMLLVLKERLKLFYGKYAAVVDWALRFGYSFLAFSLLNENVGFMAGLKNPFMVPAFSLLCAFLPCNLISFLLGMIMIVHVYSVSLEITLVLAVILISVMLLYYGFQTGDSYWMVLTPVAFFLKIPYAIPLLAGLSGGLMTAVPVCCGVIIYYILIYVKQNAALLTNDTSVDIVQKFVQIIRTLCSNPMMQIMLITAILGILIVYLVGRFPWIMHGYWRL